MIKLITGSKGSGKTKRIIKAANDEITTAKGSHVYITDNYMHTIDIDRRLRFVNIADYTPNGENWFVGFIKGMIAGNADITKIYIDGLHRFLMPPEKMESLLESLQKISISDGPAFTLTLSVADSEIPAFMKKYI